MFLSRLNIPTTQYNINAFTRIKDTLRYRKLQSNISTPTMTTRVRSKMTKTPATTKLVTTTKVRTTVTTTSVTRTLTTRITAKATSITSKHYVKYISNSTTYSVPCLPWFLIASNRGGWFIMLLLGAPHCSGSPLVA